jgi:Na+-transporting NADH:ubiquinone oxidoreductase subunit NqrF
MFIKQEKYNGKMTDILYADEGYLLEHKQTKLWYGAVSLEEGRKQSDYDEIEAPEEDNESNPID